jgi:adenosylhomocysteine nucleosidase
VRERPEAVVSTGFCGGLDPGLKRGGIFVATSVCGRECRAPATARPFFSGSLATVDRVVGTAEEKARLRATGAAAVDMESAALAERAAAAGVPFYIVRVVLDGAGESFHTDFNRMRDAAGRFSRASIARAALARPLRMLPEVIRLERRGRAAARALGDFLADCRF